MIETLQKDGHVSTAADPTDGRQVLVSLTPAGRKLTDRLVRDTAVKLRRSLGLDDDDLRRLLDLMSRLLGPDV